MTRTEGMMATTGRAAAFYGAGTPIEIKEYPVPAPEPGAALVKISLANVCGSDLHSWRGDIDYAKRGRALPRHLGHEGTGRIASLGEGVSTDSNGEPLAGLPEREGLGLSEAGAPPRAVVRPRAVLQGHVRRLLLPVPQSHRLQGA